MLKIIPLFKGIIRNINDKFILNSDNGPILDFIHDTTINNDNGVTLVQLTFANDAYMDEERFEKYQSYHKNWDINPALNEDDFEDIKGIIEDTFQESPVFNTVHHQIAISKINCSDTAFSYEYVIITISIER